ncbi:MAG TPA: AarF/UbiB family protein [Burkholderiales bacterium]|jgi:ubiquinone biosynthesis protein|nr:AarF/UbiB family protein [Burkholderiales bacterium]
MLRNTLGLMRELPRLHEIATVFIRHGLGDFVRRIGVVGLLERTGQILRSGEAAESLKLEPQQRVRMALEELGPAFVKLGQLMATRVDLFPPSWIAEFEKLQADAAPVPFDDLLPDLVRSLGRSPFEVFLDIETTACAAASIAQVHRAKLKDGTEVVLKVRRPGVRAKIDADLRLLRRVAELVDAEMPEVRRYHPVEVAAQFTRSLEREVDFATETRNIERFAKNFAGDPHIVIPKVYPEYTSDTLLVQEHAEGIAATNPAAVDAAGLDRRTLAVRGTQAFLKQILVHGFFHADPHPGNVIFLPDHRLVIIDFGMVGRLSAHRRRQVTDLLAGLARMEEEPMIEVLLDWAGDAYVDEAKLRADVDELVFDYEDVPLKGIRIGHVVRQFSAIIREHSIVLPSDLSMMFKALITLEGLGRQYDPDVHIIDFLPPLLRSALDERYQPQELVRRGRGALTSFFNVVSSVPRDFARLLREARRGKTRIELDLKRLDQFGGRMERTLDRGTMGIMTASLVIGSAIVMNIPDGPTVFGMSIFTLVGLIGYVVAFFNSLWILYGIWRAGRE